MLSYLKINPKLSIPKYRQVEDLIISGIESGILKKGQRIPSINETSAEFLLSRDTVEKAYVNLRKKGIIGSVRGKGYYVLQDDFSKRLKIGLILNKLSNYKRNLYNAFIETLGDNAIVDVYIYNHDIKVFENIIHDIQLKYDYFVILPHFKKEQNGVERIIKSIPAEKVLIIDRKLPELKDYAVVYQEYELDIREALTEAAELLQKYRRLNLFFPTTEPYPAFIQSGFIIFCQINDFKYRILERPEEENILENEAYITITDNHLYELIRVIKNREWSAGREVGIISYNENPVKEILCDGISTISTNHDQIGSMAANMILEKDFRQVKCPFHFIRRNSV
jgi:DNA-binding transcriptional regulator YhcF (GntR family)